MYVITYVLMLEVFTFTDPRIFKFWFGLFTGTYYWEFWDGLGLVLGLLVGLGNLGREHDDDFHYLVIWIGYQLGIFGLLMGLIIFMGNHEINKMV